MRLPKRKAEEERIHNLEVDNYLTPAAIKRMKRQLDDLVLNQRSEAAAEVTRTAEMGDLSENAAYQEAKHRLRRINSRILILEERLKSAIPIEQGSADGKIRIGSEVTVLVDGTQKGLHIVGSQETDPARGQISHNSPLGQALLDRVANDEIEVAGTKYQIIEVK